MVTARSRLRSSHCNPLHDNDIVVTVSALKLVNAIVPYLAVICSKIRFNIFRETALHTHHWKFHRPNETQAQPPSILQSRVGHALRRDSEA